MSDDFDSEPVPGLPENLPVGESLVWQGSPSWRSLARHSMHADKVALYFTVLSACRVAWQTANGEAFAQSLTDAAPVFAFGMVGVGLLCLASWLSSRTTIYSITNRRVVMRYGIALPMTVNIPFCEVTAADLKSYADGSGDIALTVKGPLRLAYLHLWPNVRPWHLTEAQPAIRSIPNADDIAQLLARQAGHVATPNKTLASKPTRSENNTGHSPSYASATA